MREQETKHTPDDYIKRIYINELNFESIAKYGTINGSLLVSLRDLIREVQKDCKAEQAKEIAELQHWKESEMKLWGPVLDYMQANYRLFGMRLGESISDKVLEILKDYSQQAARIQELQKVIDEKPQLNRIVELGKINSELSEKCARLEGLLNEFDTILAFMEDYSHGEEGRRITKLRGEIKSALDSSNKL